VRLAMVAAIVCSAAGAGLMIAAAGHIYPLEALYDWCVSLADQCRHFDGPIQQLRVWDDLRDQADRIGVGRIDDRTGQDADSGMGSAKTACSDATRSRTRAPFPSLRSSLPVDRSQHGLLQPGDIGDAVLRVKRDRQVAP
jgi:hypothetical protein